jgi:hypothetical protein
MDCYIQYGTEHWTANQTKMAEYILKQIILSLQHANYCEYDGNRATRANGFLECRLKVPGQIGTFTFYADVYYNLQNKNFAVEVGFQKQRYENPPLWIVLASDSKLSPSILKRAWLKRFSQL